MALSESDRLYSLREEAHFMRDIPPELSSAKPIENPLGTWRKIGNAAIFEIGMHRPLDEKPQSKIVHIEDINAYTSGVLEDEMKREIPQIVHNRRPLSIRTAVAALTTSWMG